MNTENDHTNHLANETSPYLLQHAHNPVDWYPWGPEALEKARRENKPILLSVGYSACHWCHVMAHESFEDEDTAELMNQLFVNIKVDREERPDIDKIYQTAHGLLTQRTGGWPLTVFLTPDDHVPFFAGTYFPNEPRHGMPSFTELMQRLTSFLAEHRDEIDKQKASVVNALQSMAQAAPSADTLNDEPLQKARRQLEQNYDTRYAGFGQAPKFPHPTNLEFLLCTWADSTGSDSPDTLALDMTVSTLEAMARGGMYDLLGGGFCRYSVDDRWMIPHFEKMLYDNGALLSLYAEAALATGNPLFTRICKETADWVMREMQSPEGGYYSSQDADSEGEEGKFYVWTPAEVEALLSKEEYPLFARHYGLDRAANFEGQWHLHTYHQRKQLESEFGLDSETVDKYIENARRKLFAVREQRIRPGRDDKVLTSWNGLMIRGMAIAGRCLDKPEWVASAERAVDFIRETLWEDGRLLATCKDDKAHLNAYLDDHVYLMDGLLELLQARWRDSDLLFAIELAEVLLDHFEDPAGGFFFTSDDHETLIQRPRPTSDDATPSGNGIAAKVFGRLGHLLGEAGYIKAAEKTLKGLWPNIEHMPHAHTSLLMAANESMNPVQTVILRGSGDEFIRWRERLYRFWAPRRLALAIPESEHVLPGVLAERKPDGPDGGALAYICTGLTCSTPITGFDDFETQLSLTETRKPA